MPDGLKAALFPGAQEAFGFAPTVKADAIGIGFEHAKQLGKGWKHPAGVVVVGDAPSRPVFIAHKVRWVG